MKYIIWICRMLVGGLFVVSGLIKANDPKGFSYKLQEYFAESALNLPFLEDYALILGILACLAEVVLGFALIFGGKMKVALVSLFILTVFFGWLTAYTATCDEKGTYQVTLDNGTIEDRPVTCVTDCGCFGDAMKGSIGRPLTPWESFYKDAILFFLLIPIAIFGWKSKLNDSDTDKVMLGGSLIVIALFSWVFTWYFPVIFALVCFAVYLLIKMLRGQKSDWSIAASVALLTVAFCWYCTSGLPARDYRPYAEGKSIVQGMKTAEELNLKPPVYATDFLLKHKENGNEKIFPSNVYSEQKLYKEWEYVDAIGEPYLLEDGYTPPITDFNMSDADGNDVNSEILENDAPVVLIISYFVDKADPEGMNEIGSKVSSWEKSGYKVYGLSASYDTEVEQLRHDYQLAFPFYVGDEKVLKTVVRSNPGVVLLDKGLVKKKWPSKDIPTAEELDTYR